MLGVRAVLDDTTADRPAARLLPAVRFDDMDGRGAPWDCLDALTPAGPRGASATAMRSWRGSGALVHSDVRNTLSPTGSLLGCRGD